MQAQQLFERGKDSVAAFAARGKDGARDLFVKGRETVEDRPILLGAIAAGVIATGAFLYIARKNDWF